MVESVLVLRPARITRDTMIDAIATHVSDRGNWWANPELFRPNAARMARAGLSKASDREVAFLYERFLRSVSRTGGTASQLLRFATKASERQQLITSQERAFREKFRQERLALLGFVPARYRREALATVRELSGTYLRHPPAQLICHVNTREILRRELTHRLGISLETVTQWQQRYRDRLWKQAQGRSTTHLRRA